MTECYAGNTRVSNRRAPFSPNSANAGPSCCPPRTHSLRTHYISLDNPQALTESLPFEIISRLQRRSMVVKRIKELPIESIVQGYVTGSAWSSYQKNGTVCGIALPTGLQESERLQKPSGLRVRRPKWEGKTRTSVLRMVGDFRILDIPIPLSIALAKLMAFDDSGPVCGTSTCRSN